MKKKRICDSRRITKIDLILNFSRRKISEIKLKRTDTTLDLSQKAKRAKERRKRNGGEGSRSFVPESDRKCDIC